MESCVVRSKVIPAWHVTKRGSETQTTSSLLSEIIPNVQGFWWGGAPPCAGGQENGYRRFFYAFYFRYDHGGEVFGYAKLLEDIGCVNIEQIAVPGGAIAERFAYLIM